MTELLHQTYSYLQEFEVNARSFWTERLFIPLEADNPETSVR